MMKNGAKHSIVLKYSFVNGNVDPSAPKAKAKSVVPKILSLQRQLL